jgi:trimeric autotransporter adhesin
MKKLQTTPMFRFSLSKWKTKIKSLSAATSLLLLSNGVMAQNTSYNLNAVPVTGARNSAFGIGALSSSPTGWDNTAAGFNALRANTSGTSNTGTGVNALYFNTTGWNNTATGVNTLLSNTNGNNNTATGVSALHYTTTGSNNTATGASALRYNTTGNNNTANGDYALANNTTGINNTATGSSALYNNTAGVYNTANGFQSLYLNTTGNFNTASGYQTLYANTTGNYNTAVGLNALYNNSTGLNNTAIGNYALYSNTTGRYNTAVGNGAGPNAGSYSNSVAIGFLTSNTASNQVRIGNSSTTSIGGYQGWSNVSDQRVKKDIQEKVPGLEFINKLRPVTYHLDVNVIARFLKTPDDQRIKSEEAEQANMLHTGLVAQEVEKVAKEMGYDFSGVDKPKNNTDLYGLRYAEFTIPLIKAVQELSKQNAEMKKELDELKELVKNSSGTGSIDAAETSQAKLYQNVPNPFTRSTSIRYFIPATAKKAVLLVVSIGGEKVKEFDLTGKNQDAIEVNTADLAAGNYVYSLIVNGKIIDSKKMTLTQ